MRFYLEFIPALVFGLLLDREGNVLYLALGCVALGVGLPGRLR